MTKIEIKHRFQQNTLFVCDAENMCQAVEKAAADRANLDGANLARANLDGANLAGANLAGANLDGETLIIAPISVANLTWPILITHRYMRIGCQRHSHEEWKSFDEESIKKMEGRANEFWEVWKEPLLAMCTKHYEEAMKVKGA